MILAQRADQGNVVTDWKRMKTESVLLAFLNGGGAMPEIPLLRRGSVMAFELVHIDVGIRSAVPGHWSG